MNTITKRHWYPSAPATERPSHWWYWGRAVYVSRRDYRKIFFAFLAVGLPLGAAGVLLGLNVLLNAAFAVAGIGFALFFYSLFGLYRMYGHPSMRYYRRLLEQGGVRDGAKVADLHIGTYRTAYALADLLPRSTIWPATGWTASPANQPSRPASRPPIGSLRGWRPEAPSARGCAHACD